MTPYVGLQVLLTWRYSVCEETAIAWTSLVVVWRNAEFSALERSASLLSSVLAAISTTSPLLEDDVPELVGCTVSVVALDRVAALERPIGAGEEINIPGSGATGQVHLFPVH
jgi:hypothetical protein